MGILYIDFYASHSQASFLQDEREEALAKLKSIELKYSELKVRNMLHLATSLKEPNIVIRILFMFF